MAAHAQGSAGTCRKSRAPEQPQRKQAGRSSASSSSAASTHAACTDRIASSCAKGLPSDINLYRPSMTAEMAMQGVHH